MIKLSLLTQQDGAATLETILDGYIADVFDLAEQVYHDLLPDHLNEWRRQPNVRSYPADYPGNQLPFDTAKQQRWYWANIGKPHTRSGRMVEGLEQTVERDTNSLEISASYPSAATKYVLDDIWGIKRYQQRFHKATGWQPSAPKLEQHARNYHAGIVRAYEDLIAEYNR